MPLRQQTEDTRERMQGWRLGRTGGGLQSIVEGSVTIRGGLVLLWQRGTEEKVGTDAGRGAEMDFLCMLYQAGDNSKGLRRPFEGTKKR